MSLVRPSVWQDAHELATRLREEDVAEIRASSGSTPIQALQSGILSGTESYTIVTDAGLLIGIFGINHVPELGPGQACVWMLATPELPSIKLELFERWPFYVDSFHHRYPLLWNFVDARNETHLKWIKRCGFTFLKLHEKFGYEQRPFYEFVRLKESEVPLV